jgi:exosortase/archaeosortase family protein
MKHPFSAASLRTGIAAAVVAGAVHLAQSRDGVVDFTRPLVLGTLRFFGTQAVDCGEELRVGKLLVPWTRDCAGINLLFILLALAVWVNRKESRAWRFWLCMLGMVPAAALANVLRVLTLLAYRTVAYPGVESPQTHYFIGFIWLVPFITLITPRDKRPLSAGLMETLHAAAVVALLAPQAGTPNATLLTLAAVVALAQCRLRDVAARGSSWHMAAWVAAGAGIAGVGMESFWLPWLLVCPLLVQARWVFSVPGLACLACTQSLVAMQPWSWAVAAVGGAWVYFYGEGAEEMTNSTARVLAMAEAARADAEAMADGDAEPVAMPAPAVRVSARPMIRAWQQAAFFACLTFPFLASTLLAIGQQSWAPPAGMMARRLAPDCYEVRLRGQPQEIGLACYSSASRDRHHTLRVCLKYRGIELSSVEGSPEVLTDGTTWFREFFVQDGHILADYPAYVRSTFIPWSEPGLHLIFVSKNGAQTPAEFNAACEKLAQRFFEECAPESAMRVAAMPAK